MMIMLRPDILERQLRVKYDDVQLQKMNKEIEQFMISVANTSVTSSESIAGVGVFF